MAIVMQWRHQITGVNTFGERLRARRIALGLSQKQVAQASGLTQSAVANYESGLRHVPRDVLALARTLEVSARWLRDGIGTPHEDGAADGQGTRAPRPMDIYRALEVITTAIDAMEDQGRYDVERMLVTIARAPDSAKARDALAKALCDTPAASPPPAPLGRSGGNRTGTDG